MDVNEFLPLIPDSLYDPSEVILIGSHMSPTPEQKPNKFVDETNMKPQDREKLMSGEMQLRSDFAERLTLVATPKEIGKDAAGEPELSCPTIALIYAYGYEGHIYRLSKPRIMIVRGAGKPYEETQSQGNSRDMTGKLYMWRLSKHQQTISIEVESGELKTLVLEGNQPGNRSVNSYAAHMQMAHRGGKLT